jgi:hypothetical protein
MIPTVEQVIDRVAFLVGDTLKRKFKQEDIQLAFASAYEEIFDYLLQYQISTVELQTTYHLTAATVSRTPAEMSITNFGELVRLEERPYGSSEDYTDVHAVDELPQSDQDAALSVFKWRNDTFYFIGATRDIELKVTYNASAGDAPTTGTTGIDNSLNFLAYRAAAIVGPTKGLSQSLCDRYDVEARGPNRDGGAGALHRLLQPMVRNQQKTPLQQPAYEAGGGTAAPPYPIVFS